MINTMKKLGLVFALGLMVTACGGGGGGAGTAVAPVEPVEEPGTWSAYTQGAETGGVVTTSVEYGEWTGTDPGAPTAISTNTGWTLVPAAANVAQTTETTSVTLTAPSYDYEETRTVTNITNTSAVTRIDTRTCPNSNCEGDAEMTVVITAASSTSIPAADETRNVEVPAAVISVTPDSRPIANPAYITLANAKINNGVAESINNSSATTLISANKAVVDAEADAIAELPSTFDATSINDIIAYAKQNEVTGSITIPAGGYNVSITNAADLTALQKLYNAAQAATTAQTTYTQDKLDLSNTQAVLTLYNQYPSNLVVSNSDGVSLIDSLPTSGDNVVVKDVAREINGKNALNITVNETATDSNGMVFSPTGGSKDGQVTVGSNTHNYEIDGSTITYFVNQPGAPVDGSTLSNASSFGLPTSVDTLGFDEVQGSNADDFFITNTGTGQSTPIAVADIHSTINDLSTSTTSVNSDYFEDVKNAHLAGYTGHGNKIFHGYSTLSYLDIVATGSSKEQWNNSQGACVINNPNATGCNSDNGVLINGITGDISGLTYRNNGATSNSNAFESNIIAGVSLVWNKFDTLSDNQIETLIMETADAAPAGSAAGVTGILNIGKALSPVGNLN